MDFEDLPYADMTTYERKVWAALSSSPEEDAVDGDQSGGRQLVGRARERVERSMAVAAEKGRDAWEQVPGNEKIQYTMAVAINGAFRAYLDLLSRTVDQGEIRDDVAGHADLELIDLAGIRTVDLKHVHTAMPNLGVRRAAIAGLHGAAAGFVSGGATAAGAATGGMGALPAAGVFATTLVADAAGVVSSQLQASSLIAAYHGYEPVDGAGNYEVLRLQAAVAAAGAAKGALLKEVRELALALAAKRTVAQLNEMALYQAMRRLFAWLTLSTTKRGIAKGVPIAGVVLGGGWNYGTLRKGIGAAEEFYDLRFLADKYGYDGGGTGYTVEAEVMTDDDTGVLDALDQLPLPGEDSERADG